ncbi:MAG: HEPN domain-containing protein [Promethearchaeota archaeon]
MKNNQNSFNRWFSQAKFDLEAAKTSLKAGNYEWACFQAQQAAEKTLKAYLYLNGKRLIITHSIHNLLQECNKIDTQFQTIRKTKALDLYYIPTRYPNGLPDQIPHEFYKKEDAKLCVNYAETILSLIENLTKK